MDGAVVEAEGAIGSSEVQREANRERSRETRPYAPAADVVATVRRWLRQHKPTQKLIESQAQAAANPNACLSTSEGDQCSDANDYNNNVYHGAEEYEIQRQMADPIAFAASADPDVMYLHEAMKQPGKKEFVKAMINEVTTHTERGHWKIIPVSEVPEGTKILPAVWAMRRKRRIMSR